MKTTVLIIGRHRSGTSLVSGLLHKLGVNMIEPFIPSTPFNSLGFFESEDLICLHEKIIVNWEFPVINLTQELEIEHLKLLKQRDKVPLWGFKDPRLCYLLPLFTKNLSDRKIKIIDVNRPLLESAYSLTRRPQNITMTRAIDICEKYDHNKDKNINNFSGEILSVDYNNVLQNPEIELSRLCNFLGVNYKEDVSCLIKTKLRTSNIIKTMYMI